VAEVGREEAEGAGCPPVGEVEEEEGEVEGEGEGEGDGDGEGDAAGDGVEEFVDSLPVMLGKDICGTATAGTSPLSGA